MSVGDILWTPRPEAVEATQLHTFMQRAASQHGFDPVWPMLHRWSCQHPDQFWSAMFDHAAIKATQPARAVMSGSGMLGTRWFDGMTLNYAAHLLRRYGDSCAIVAQDERGRIRRINWSELRDRVAQFAAALKRIGIGSGDRVAGCLPNVPEAIIAMLGTAALGAVWSSCSPDFGLGGIVDRFGQIGPRLLLIADGYTYNGKRIATLEKQAVLAERIEAVEQVVVIPFLDDAPDLSHIDRATTWNAFLESAGPAELTFEPVPFDHPLFIMYSSGTTGVPKCIVHGHGGTLLQHMKELALHCDVRPHDVVFYFTTCGWMMWNWVASALGTGATLAMYEGNPGTPDLGRLWRFVQEAGITVFGTSPKFLKACAQAEVLPGKDVGVETLRCVLSTGSPLTADLFEWSYAHIKSDMQLSSICGGTDIISCFMLGNPILPVRSGEIQCIGLGMDVRAFDEDGRSAIGQQGELVCCTPFPSQPVRFWNDEDDRRYKAAYFERYDDVWRHGDFVKITPSGSVQVFGRSDATLNPGGIRIGTAEIYRIVESMDEITDSVVVGHRVADDVDVCLFVVVAEGVCFSDELVLAIKRRIADGATRRHVPAHVLAVPAIPYTISGKKVEMAVSRMIHGQPVDNRDALANPDALDSFAGVI
jgi:acetoacetyl-CoA synthetase